MSALRIGKGLENSYAYEVNKSATERWLEKMVAQGKLPQSALDALQQRTADSRLETTIIKSRPAAEIVPEYKKGRIPVARHAYNVLNDVRPSMGGMSFGRARWSVDGASIFSVADGKRLAQEPPRLPTAFEAARMNRVSKAALDTPLLNGYRLLPQFTPGRALMWGTILALWGTGAIVMSSFRALNIQRVDEAEDKLRSALAPLVETAAGVVEPWKGWLTRDTLHNTPRDPDSDFARLTQTLRLKLAERS